MFVLLCENAAILADAMGYFMACFMLKIILPF